MHDVTPALMWMLKLPCILQQTLNGLDIWVEKEMKQVYYVTNTRHTPALPALFIDQNTLDVSDSKSWGHHPCHGRLRWNTC